MLHILGYWAVRESLEIEQTCISPPHCIARLDAQFALHLGKTLRIDTRLHGIPIGEETTSRLHAAVVLMAQFVPERASALHAEIPGHMVEPCDEILRTSTYIVVKTAERVGILLHIGRARERAVEAQSDAVGPMIIRRCPVGPQSLGAVPRFRPIVVSACEDMMNAQRHHVVDTRLAALHHQV